MGAVAIEKHFKLDNIESGPDASFSLNPGQFTSLLKIVTTLDILEMRGLQGLKVKRPTKVSVGHYISFVILARARRSLIPMCEEYARDLV